jgi:regulatory protein
MTDQFKESATNGKQSNKKKKPRRPKKITPTYLHNYALYYLERFASPSANLKRVLMRRVQRSIRYHGEPTLHQAQEWVDDLITRFVQTGLVDDDFYAKGRTRSLRRAGNSRRQITAKLMQKGLDYTAIDSALDEVDVENGGDLAEQKAAIRYVQRRRLGIKPERYEKDLAALARAGFSFDLAKWALDNVQKDKNI